MRIPRLSRSLGLPILFGTCALCSPAAGDAQAASASEAKATPLAAVTPPVLIERVDAVYPQAALRSGQEGTVELAVTVLADGGVGEVTVLASAGQAFDDAAVAAVRRWRFVPAKRGESPVAARLRIPFVFEQPLAVLEAAPGPEAAGAPTGTAPPARTAKPVAAPPTGPEANALPQVSDSAGAAASPSDEALEVTVVGTREAADAPRGSADVRIDHTVLKAAPRSEGSEVLRSAPGLYIGRGEGPAVAHNYMLRGFDAEHGQDIAFSVGGVPINLPSHIHGQGYADLSFLIADTVAALDVREGIYDPSQGDFAVAGSIDVQLAVPEEQRGTRVRSGFGSFNTFEQLALVAPEGQDDESFAAGHVSTSDGFGQRRAGTSGDAIVQHRIDLGRTSLRLLGIVHGARAELAGVVRMDDVDAGRVCFRCAYNAPSAQAQSALAQRVIAGLFVDHAGAAGDETHGSLWLSLDNFRIQENFTGYLQRSQTLPGVQGRGDLIEQQNQTLSIGVSGRHATAPLRPSEDVHLRLLLGAEGRMDVIDQSQHLLDAAVRNQTWDRRVDASIRGLDVGVYGDVATNLGEHLEARVGVRGDVLSYAVDDRLGNFVPASRPSDTFLVGYRRTAYGVAVGPRASVKAKLTKQLALLAAYGQGFRSPQARTLEDGENAPYSRVHSFDAGGHLDLGEVLQLKVSGYYTRLSDDIAFDAEEGQLTRIGGTQRLGMTLSAISHPLPFITAAASMTTVQATLLEPPPPSAEDPAPPFVEGQRLPYVPPVVLRFDGAAKRALPFSLLDEPFVGNAGLGLSYLSPRPLPYGGAAAPVGLIDVSLGVAWGPLELGFAVYNALNARYAAVVYNFPSAWNTDTPRSRIPAQHIAAGAPRSYMATLGVNL